MDVEIKQRSQTDTQQRGGFNEAVAAADPEALAVPLGGERSLKVQTVMSLVNL